MRRQLLLVLAVLLLAPLAAPAQELKPYTASGLFRVSFPGTPQTQDEANATARSRQWIVELDESLFAVSVDEVLGSAAPKPEGWFFEQRKAEVASFDESDDVKVREVSHRGMTGRAFSAKGVEAVTFVLPAAQRSVTLFVLYVGTVPAQTRAFFDSLEVLERPAGSAAAAQPAPPAKSSTPAQTTPAPSTGGGLFGGLFGGGGGANESEALEGFDRLKPDAEFSVMMPKVTRALDPQSAPRPAGYWAGIHRETRYSVQYFTAKLSELERTTAADYLEQQMDLVVDRERGRVIESRRLSLHGYPGREFTLETAQALSDYRLFLVGTRVYTLSVTRARGIEAPEKDAFFRSLELHYRPQKVATKKGVRSSRSSLAAFSDPNAIRARRKVALGLEGGWNGLAGAGPVVSYYVIPRLAIDAGVGRSASGFRTGTRLRFLPFTGNVTPHVGAGIQYGFGLDEPVQREQMAQLPPVGEPNPFEEPPVREVSSYLLGVGSQLRVQGVVGLDAMTDGGFSLGLNVGYSYGINGNNFRYGGYTPSVEERRADARDYGGGWVGSVQLGYAF